MSKKQKEDAKPRLKRLSKKKTKSLLRIISVVGAIMFVAGLANVRPQSKGNQ